MFVLVFLSRSVSAQIVESVGARALGMGGAFVALANDSSATWWNPAGLAAGPFFDLSLGHGRTSIDGGLPPARRERATWIAAGTPPFGLSYYRLNVADIGQFRSIAPDSGDREDRRVAVPGWSLSASQLGATLVHTLVSGVHVGTTLKYVRVNGLGAELTGSESSSVSEWLDRADDLEAEQGTDSLDLDVGVLAVRGPVRAGVIVRNVRETELGAVKLPRQARVGVALDVGEAAALPLVLAMDADLRSYSTPFGARRVVAVGGEGWSPGGRVGVRAGARVNTAGEQERAFTAGGSLAVRPGLFVEGYLVLGGNHEEEGWGLAARVSF